MRPLLLLLEDEALIAMDVADVLEEAGYSVVTIASARDALDWLDAHVPDIAVVDVYLPDGDCEPVATALQSRGIPFLVHSGSIAKEFADTPFAGAPWVSKPVRMEELLAAITSARVNSRLG